MNQRRKTPNQQDEAEEGNHANGTSTQVSDQAQKSKVRNKNSQNTRDAWKASTQDGSALDMDSLPDEIVLERAKRPKAKGGVNRRTSYTIKAPGTPFHELDLSEIPWLHHDAADESVKRGYMRYRRLFFIAGILAGAILAYALSHHVVLESHIQNLRGVIDEQLSDIGINLSSLDLSSFSIPSELAQLGNDLFSVPRKWSENGDFTVAVGERLRQEGLEVNYPVVLLPGIVSTGLESWSTEPGVFRKRLWGSMSMVRTIATQKEMWIRQLSLDPSTGLDPPGIKVRAAEGLDAASYFVSGYWIWDPIIRALAVIGYDPNNLSLASYDWRLSFHNLEVRDRVFSRLKLQFEQNLFLTGKKSVLVAHSMGSTVALYFMKWVEAEGPGYGNGGPDWVDKHIESFVSIAGTFLGVPKAMAALLSGEMRDTVELPPAAAYLLEKFFSRRERAKLFQTWAGSASMLIKGGNAVWGNETWAPDDEPGSSMDQSHGKVYSFKMPEGAAYQGAGDAALPVGGSAELHETSTQHALQGNLSANDAYNWLLQHTPSTFQQMVQKNYSDGIEYSEEQIKKNNQIEKTWANPLEAALPNAPNMKLHCIYGVGKQTERSYWYTQGPYERDEFIAEGEAATCLDCGNQTSTTPLDFPTSRTSWIDTSIHDEKSTPQVRSGVKFSDGDGTVSVHSLGAMCVEGWKRKRYNPAGIKVYTHEIAHEPEPLDLRGGSTTGDHVDILGSFRVNEIVLRVAAGLGHTVNESFFSNEREYAKKIAWDAPLA